MEKNLKKLLLLCIGFWVLLMNPNGVYASTVKTLKDVNSLDSVTFYYNNVKDLDTFWEQWEQDGVEIHDIESKNNAQLNNYNEKHMDLIHEMDKKNNVYTKQSTISTTSTSQKRIILKQNLQGITTNTTVCVGFDINMYVTTRQISGTTYELFVSFGSIMTNIYENPTKYIFYNQGTYDTNLTDGNAGLQINQTVEIAHPESYSIGISLPKPWNTATSYSYGGTLYKKATFYLSMAYKLPIYYDYMI